MKRLSFIAAILLGCSIAVSAQENGDATFNADSTHHIINIFRPNYLCTGLPTNHRPTADNCDVKFQVSLKVDVLRNKWNKEFDVFLGYTQLSVWNLYAQSSPFYDNTYMPGLYTYIPFRSKKTGKVSNDILFGYEHRSNGRNDTYSRSVNYAFITYSHYFPCNLTLQATARIGDGWYGEVQTLDMYTKYLGYVNFAMNYTTPKKNWDFNLSVSPVWNKSIANINAEIGFSPFKKYRDAYIFVQYHYGYDEACRDCRCTSADPVLENGLTGYDKTLPSIAPKQSIRFGMMLNPHTLARLMY